MKKGLWIFVAMVSVFILTTNHVYAQADSEIEEIKSQIEVITEEIEKLKLGAVAEPSFESFMGLGPAASKVYFVDKGLSIGGYGDITYENFLDSSKTDRGDTVRFIPYIGYKFSDRVIMNTEIEFEHAAIKDIKTRSPEVYIEFMYIDFLLNKKMNLRPGLVLIPSSRFNEYHEPVVFYGALKPDVERNIIPTVWRELGIMAHGDLGGGLTYKTALVNGIRTDTMKTWIGDGRQRGAEANFNKLAGIIRLDYSGIKGLNIGVSLYTGKGEDKKGAEERGAQRADFNLYVLEAQYQRGNAFLKGLYALGDADGNDSFKAVSSSLAKEVYGWYLEGAYNMLPHISPESMMSFAPFARYERYDLNKEVLTGTPDPKLDREVLTAGIDFKPHPQVVLKADYQLRDTDSDLPEGKGTGLDENKIDQFNMGIGFIF